MQLLVLSGPRGFLRPCAADFDPTSMWVQRSMVVFTRSIDLSVSFHSVPRGFRSLDCFHSYMFRISRICMLIALRPPKRFASVPPCI
ncbi:hypothetical protein BDW69DRAFT_99197 [Aspergillus filifer]